MVNLVIEIQPELLADGNISIKFPTSSPSFNQFIESQLFKTKKKKMETHL